MAQKILTFSSKSKYINTKFLMVFAHNHSYNYVPNTMECRKLKIQYPEVKPFLDEKQLHIKNVDCTKLKKKKNIYKLMKYVHNNTYIYIYKHTYCI